MTKGGMARLLLGALALGGSVPAAAGWRRAESDNFVLYGQGSEEKLREQIALLEDYNDFLRSTTGVSDPPSPNKLPVYLVRGPAELKTIRNMGSNVGGFYSASSSGIAAFVDERAGHWDDEDNHVLFHEIAHHFMMQYRPTAYPPWYVEGFAEYLMTARFKPKTIEFGRPSTGRVVWLSHAPWLPLEKVLFSRPPRKEMEIHSFYGQSWLLAHYIQRDPQLTAKFQAYLTAMVKGEEPRSAFIAQFGELKAFQRDLEIYGRRGLTYTVRPRASAAAQPRVTVRTLPESADALLLREAALHIGVRNEDGPRLLSAIRDEAAKFPLDPYARRVLAEAEVLHGDRVKGTALLAGLLASDPNDVELLYLHGLRYLIDARAGKGDPDAAFKAARHWFARAHQADSNHFPTLARYAESLRSDARFDSDNTMNILLLAQELAPQVSELGMAAAEALIMRSRFAEAEALLLPLASSPHNEGLASAATALLRQARARSKTPLPQAGEEMAASE